MFVMAYSVKMSTSNRFNSVKSCQKKTVTSLCLFVDEGGSWRKPAGDGFRGRGESIYSHFLRLLCVRADLSL